LKGSEFFTRLARTPPFRKIHPNIAGFLKEYLQGEKAVEFDGKLVINTHFPPFPGSAFDRLMDHFNDREGEKRLFNITVAVTNRCPFNCWHCYNHGRSQADIPVAALKSLARRLQSLGAVTVQLTGGEPLLRDDLEEVFSAFDDRTTLLLGTTGLGLTYARAAALRRSGLFAVGISLDSMDETKHDAMRGYHGAFRIALDAIGHTRNAGLYPYVVAVATRDFLEEDHFMGFMEFAGSVGALEVHLLEPCPTGKLAGRTEVNLSGEEQDRIISYQKRIARREDMPILSTFAYLESSAAFGCGAGLSHLYVDGSGEVCPCNLVPMSFGNIQTEELAIILQRLDEYFRKPRRHCLGKILTPMTWGLDTPTPPDVSAAICREHLSTEHPMPDFFAARASATGEAGSEELQDAYDTVAGDYDQYWLSSADGAIRDLAARADITHAARIVEVGCGTGFGTALYAAKAPQAEIIAIDISEPMIALARAKFREAGFGKVRFIQGDALEVMRGLRDIDFVITSWVLGYIRLTPFFKACAQCLVPGGQVALIVHKENSPQRETAVFAEIAAEEPSALLRRVSFDFPRDLSHLEEVVRDAGLEIVESWQDAAVFHYPSPRLVLDHLLKSGAGTVFYEAIRPERREELTARFLQKLEERSVSPDFEVRHEYVGCIARWNAKHPREQR
jgi:MoaA/NifB/PqqE/SkfB family radical SAM enzyme/SAM-dependent methyltransferase